MKILIYSFSSLYGLLLISFIYQCGIDIGGIDNHYTCMALVVGRYEGLLTRRSHIFRSGTTLLEQFQDSMGKLYLFIVVL
jgi:hypothetical protein